MKLLILVVNYNLNILKSSTFKSLIQQQKRLKNSKIIIWDNLLKIENEKIINEKLKYIEKKYIGSKENISLSKIYNNILNKYFEGYDYLVLFDNDSNIKENYFIELKNIIKKNVQIELILPKIIHNKKVYSPQENYPVALKKSKLYNEIDFGVKDVKNIFAINSGMVISRKYLERTAFRYNESMNFYGTDNYFMYIYQKNSKNYFLMKYKLNHDLSLGKKEELEKILWRYNDSLISQRVFLVNYKGKEKIIFFLKIFKQCLVMTFKYKKIIFLRLFFKKNN